MVELRVPTNDLQEEYQEVVTKYTPVTQAVSKTDIKKAVKIVFPYNFIISVFHWSSFKEFSHLPNIQTCQRTPTKPQNVWDIRHLHESR